MRSGRTLLPQGRSLPTLVLVALLVGALGEDMIFHPEWGFESYEIIIPKKLSFRGGQQGAVEQVSYLLQVKGKKYVLHLWPKRFLLPRNLKVLSYTEQEKLLEDHPYIPRDCNYVGSVEGTQDSEATLSTCMGSLRGILKIDEEHYQIEPLRGSSSFEHVIYLLKEEDKFQNHTCGLTNDELEKQIAQNENLARCNDFSISHKHQKYMGVSLVFDQVDICFQNPLLLKLHLKSIEICTHEYRITITKMDVQDILKAFVKYYTTYLSAQIPGDWAHLYISKSILHVTGYGSLSSFINLNILAVSRLSAHELGHGVGMKHDTESCQCRGRRTCIMGAGNSRFSNCSYSEFFDHTCENKIEEGNEECDCGSREECKKDNCCHMGCKLMQGANCSTRLCCRNCYFRPLGYMCREEDNECDLAEYCNGISNFFPDDSYKLDGTPCKHNSLCLRERCRSRYVQCQNIFGADAREAPDQCYHAVNLMGDQYGNCEILGVRAYKACTKANAMCGRLQCINVNTIPDLPEHTIVISTHLREEDLMCWGVGYHKAMIPMGIPDIGVINDGTRCGYNGLCINRTCVNDSAFETIKNKNKNCHCMYGWVPPFYEEVGYGGSIDSGPARKQKEEVPTPVQVVSIMLVRLIFLVISVFVVFFERMIRQYMQSKQK
ncbi:unnamed protein product [Nyctereutes procyonoides]|uniref:(raccoon dog) hypothetical protein n=1 Tax=Nyctereutes procyonoides TaxID=34880 RepID=A0A811ZX26_NYCPR|nr:unnamed protein product [Nyctereutes procyonoides]